MMDTKTKYVLHKDVVTGSVKELSESFHSKVKCEETDFAIFKKGARAKAKIIDAGFHSFLMNFKDPATILDAVIAESKKSKLDPVELLKGVHEPLKIFVNAKFLIDSEKESSESITMSLELDSEFMGFRINECLWLLEDTEVYEVYSGKNEKAVLKIAKNPGNGHLKSLFENEASVLRALDGGVSPRLFESGTFEDRPFLIMEWCHGARLDEALKSRIAQNDPEERREILKICQRTASRYAEMHSRGFFHNDVNYKNILFMLDGSIKLIDFGFSVPVEETHQGRVFRAGFDEFYDPQLIAAKIDRTKLPYVSERSELYSLSAMLYFCITGKHYLDFKLEKSEMWAQIVKEEPRKFKDLGLEPWPELESVLAKALNKREEDRFSGMEEFAHALENVSESSGTVRAKPEDNSGRMRFLDDFLRDARDVEAMQKKVLNTPPIVQFNCGLSGLAYAVYRIAYVRNAPELLSLADIYNAKALSLKDSQTAFYSEGEIDLPLDKIGPISLYHTETGLRTVEALIAIAMGNYPVVVNSVKRLTELAGLETEKIDLTLGSSGLLIGFRSVLKEAENTYLFGEMESAKNEGNRIARNLLQRMRDFPKINKCDDFHFLGIAHGWAGLIYALLCWNYCEEEGFHATLKDRLTQLIELADVSSMGISWPRVLKNHRHSREKNITSWCNGSAGFIFLLIKAYETFGERKYLDLAEKVGIYTLKYISQQEAFDLCCGYAGRAYSLLALYRATGDQAWLTRARSMIDHVTSDGVQRTFLKRSSLYKGEFGLALICAELETPDKAKMPLFEI